MIKIITTIITILSTVFRFFKKQKPNEERMKYDNQLKDAIQRGDSEEVARLREYWKHYSGVILVVFSILIGGCFTIKISPPLTEGMIPYQLKTPAIYEDIKGNLHKEDKPRWSISEADLFRDTVQISEQASNSKFEQMINKIGGYFTKNTVYFIALIGLLLILKTINNYKKEK